MNRRSPGSSGPIPGGFRHANRGHEMREMQRLDTPPTTAEQEESERRYRAYLQADARKPKCHDPEARLNKVLRKIKKLLATPTPKVAAYPEDGKIVATMHRDDQGRGGRHAILDREALDREEQKHPEDWRRAILYKYADERRKNDKTRQTNEAKGAAGGRAKRDRMREREGFDYKDYESLYDSKLAGGGKKADAARAVIKQIGIDTAENKPQSRRRPAPATGSREENNAIRTVNRYMDNR